MPEVVASIAALNPVLYPREGVFQCVVPFQPGVVTNLGALSVVGAIASEFEPFGKPYPDGSARFARVSARVTMASAANVDFDVVKDSTVWPATAKAVPSGVLLRSMFENDHEASSAIAASPSGPASMSNVGSWTTIRYVKGRLWYEWRLYQEAGQSVVHWRLSVGFSDPGSRDLWLQLTEPVDLVIDAGIGFLFVDWKEMKGVTSRPVAGNVVTTFLPAGTTIAHGQRHEWRGMFSATPMMLDNEKAILAVAKSWPAVGVGPLGIVPVCPPWMPTALAVRLAVERMIVARNAAPRRDPYFDPKIGLGKTSAEAGAQDDFGTIHGIAGFLGVPAWLDLAIPDVLQEGLRPTHFREADGSKALSAAHPRLNLWMGRPHRMLTVSPDQLGKPNEDSWDQLGLRAGYDAARHGWAGLDPQHTSLLALATAAMLTGDPQLVDLLDDFAETYLSSYTLPSTHPGYFSSAMDAARAVGRLGYTCAWMDLILDRQDIRDRNQGRLTEVILRTWNLTSGNVVRPLDIVPRVNLAPSPGNLPEWHPWQEGIAVHGLLCMASMLDSKAALRLALSLAENMVLYGWEDRTTYQRVAKAVEYSGLPVPRNPSDPTKYISSDGTDYDIWCLAAVQFVARTATSPAAPTARAILNGIHEQRPSDGFFSVYGRYVGGQLPVVTA